MGGGHRVATASQSRGLYLPKSRELSRPGSTRRCCFLPAARFTRGGCLSSFLRGTTMRCSTSLLPAQCGTYPGGEPGIRPLKAAMLTVLHTVIPFPCKPLQGVVFDVMRESQPLFFLPPSIA